MSDAASWLASAGFDPDAYLRDNPDLGRAGLAAADAPNHFLRFGYAENRRIVVQPLPAGLDAFHPCVAPDAAYRARLCQAVYASQCRMAESAPYLWTGETEALDRFFAQTNAVPFYVIGDSHSNLYNRHAMQDGGWLAPVPLLCSAGSAMGLARPKSRSGYGQKILAWAESNAKQQAASRPVFLKFGQVDVEFVWNFQRIRSAETAFSLQSFDSFAQATARSYLGFVGALADKIDKSRLRVCAIFPPALGDAVWAEGYVNGHVGVLEGDRSKEALEAGIRTLEIPDLRTRKILHTIFNSYLRAGCLQAGVAFVDDFHPFLDATGVLDPAFVPHSKGRDHHLDHGAVHGPLVRVIGEALQVRPGAMPPDPARDSRP